MLLDGFGHWEVDHALSGKFLADAFELSGRVVGEDQLTRPLSDQIRAFNQLGELGVRWYLCGRKAVNTEAPDGSETPAFIACARSRKDFELSLPFIASSGQPCGFVDGCHRCF